VPIFEYEAIDRRGRTLTGTMPAIDETTLEQKLRNTGLWLTEAGLQRAGVDPNSAAAIRGRRFKLRGAKGRRELIDFCTLMTFQVRVGIPIVKALEVASQDCKNIQFQEVLTGLQGHIEGGLQFHEAMAYYPGVFSTHFVSVIKAGEMTSNMPEAFNDLRDYLEWLDRVLADVRQATMYPAIIATVVLCFVIFLFSFIIPKFAALLSQLKVQQPLLTRMVFAVGKFTQATWYFWLPTLLFFVFAVLFGRRLSKRVALAIDYAKLHIPLFGELNVMLALSRFTHNLALLYRSGLPVLQSLALCQHGLIGNAYIEKAVAGVEEDVKTGSTISEALHRRKVFTALLKRMVAMGETSGNLDSALNNVSAYYTEVVPRRIKTIFSVFEPTLMLFLILIVGCVALAIYLPILALMTAARPGG
jgi:type IV pilus assembly protein PilC